MPVEPSCAIDLMSFLNRRALKWFTCSPLIGVLLAICTRHVRQKQDDINEQYICIQLETNEICWNNGKRSFVLRFQKICGVLRDKIVLHLRQTSLTVHSDKSSRYEKILSRISTGSFSTISSFTTAWSGSGRGRDSKSTNSATSLGGSTFNRRSMLKFKFRLSTSLLSSNSCWSWFGISSLPESSSSSENFVKLLFSISICPSICPNTNEWHTPQTGCRKLGP